MATSVLDARARAGTAGRTTPTAVRLRRVPVTALAAGLLGVLEGLGLLAVGLTGLDGVLLAPSRPGAALLAAALVGLAGWVVLAAGTGVGMVDGTGRGGLVALAKAETVLAGALAFWTVVALLGVAPGPPVGPAAAAALVALPVAKLLLAGTGSARRWLAQGPPPRETRPDPVAAHRALAAVTVGLIGAGLLAVTFVAPVPEGGADLDGTVARVVQQP
jgi:hypothetical protein